MGVMFFVALGTNFTGECGIQIPRTSMSFHCTHHIVCNVVHSTLSGICFFKDQWRQWKEHHFRTFGGRTAQI